jgi:hypothetical protein
VLNATSLDTERTVDPYDGAARTGTASYKAHTKTDGASGDWILVGLKGRANPELHAVVMDTAAATRSHKSFE